MCTSVAMNIGDFYFGRNMDLEGSFGECVVMAPRHFPFPFRKMPEENCHYAMIGMAAVSSGYPLFADAMNEKGLCMAGLNFPGNAAYQQEEDKTQYGVTPFELIPWVLGTCATVGQAERLLSKTRLIAIPFSESVPLTPLHWHLADRERSIVIEPMADGLRLYENPTGALTNNPPFPYHLANLARYAHLNVSTPCGEWTADEGAVSMGMGGVGLPGDYSSASRFVKVSFLKKHALSFGTKEEAIDTVFRILSAVAPPKGSVIGPNGLAHYTTYTGCMDTAKRFYYCQRQGALGTKRFEMCHEELEGDKLIYKNGSVTAYG